jgi:aspartate aminotransferase
MCAYLVVMATVCLVECRSFLLHFFYLFHLLLEGRKFIFLIGDMFDASQFRSVGKSQTLLLNEQSRNLESTGREVFKFGFGQSPFPPLPSAVAELQAQSHQKAYSPVQGIAELRERVAAFHRDAERIDVTADQVVVASGSKILIYAIMAVFKEADVLIPTPAWVSYDPQAKLIGHATIRVGCNYTGRWRVTPDALEDAVAAKKNAKTPSILIFNHPGNPDGLSYTDDELVALSAVMTKHNILVIADEIYGLLHHTGGHKSLAEFYPEGTIVTGGLSKWCGAGGWRLGVAMLPRSLGVGETEFKSVLLGIASETYSCAPLPIQLAAVKAYQWHSAELQTYIGVQRKLLSFIGNWCADTLRAVGIEVHNPQGGFYLFVDFSPFKAELASKRGINTSAGLCQNLLITAGVALLPADAFGMEMEYLAARLAFVEFDGAFAMAEAAKLGDAPIPTTFLDSVFAKTARGIHAIESWVRAI